MRDDWESRFRLDMGLQFGLLLCGYFTHLEVDNSGKRRGVWISPLLQKLPQL